MATAPGRRAGTRTGGGRSGGAGQARRGRVPRGAPATSRALHTLAPLLDALVEAADLSPLSASRSLGRALRAGLGWRVRVVPSPSPLATGEHAHVEDGVALVPIAPGAGALRLSGGSHLDLARVAALCAHAFARARTHPLEPGRRAGPRGRPRVLVASEDPVVRQALAQALAPRHEPVHAEDAAAALEAARSGRFDAALLALAAPGADALATLERLRADVASAELPTLLLTVPAGEAARLRTLELGADLLPPACSPVELAARLDQAIHLARATRALRDEAQTDPLTGLPNRRALEARLHEELRRARRYGTPLACVMADLDHLKAINDSLGHAAGDQALQGMAAVLRGGLRDTDFAARAGGDEFLLLLPHTSAEEACLLAERVRRGLAAVRLGPGRAAAAVGASLGVAALGADADGEAMVEAADRALYAAKRAGRGTVRLGVARLRGDASTDLRRRRR